MKRTLAILGLAVSMNMVAQTDQDVQTRDQVVNDDQIVKGSLAVGMDAVDGENFGFDTFRLKENNLRIHFDDTSASASFPKNDWRITINDTGNGGKEFFAIDDATANTNPFRIMAGAKNNAFHINNKSFVGLSTDNPLLNLHVKYGNSPGLRLEQDNSSGWGTSIWDVAGNEVNFFIRDAKNGSKLPFRIRPGAPTSSIDIAATGSVGIEKQSPNAKASLDLGSKTKGLLINRLTNAERTTLEAGLNASHKGLMIYATEDNALNVWNGTAWVNATLDTDDQKADVFNLNGNTLELSLQDDGEATKTVDLSAFKDNTDSQKLTSATLTGKVLEIGIENGNTVSVNLAPLIQDIENRLTVREGCECHTLPVTEHTPGVMGPVLHQNLPNPFNGTTLIKYYLPQNADAANIVFSNGAGQIVKTVALTQKGEHMLEVNSNEFSTGMYYYTLYIGGKFIDSKKMIVE